MTIRLFTLGGLRGTLEGTGLDRLTAQPLSAALLVHVAIERTVTRDTLMALLWPDQNAETAGHRLSQLLYSLRRTIDEGCIDVRGREIRAGGDLEVDARDFERAVEDGRAAASAELYAGPFLHGVHLVAAKGFEEWVDRRRAHYARSFRAACRALVNERGSAGDVAGALDAARRWVAPDPLDDEAQHRLIELLANAGQRSEALKQFGIYEDLLRADGLDPLDDTTELVRRIRESTARPATAAERRPLAAGDVEALVRSGLAPEFEVVRTLGRGSTATVWLARDTALQRRVAVKVLSPGIAGDDVARLRFEREARSAARITHTNVAQIYRLGLLGGTLPFILMEFVDGRSLSGLVAARGPLPPADARTVLRAIAAGLSAAHARGIVHRDVTPGNVLLENRSGRPVLTDFGLAGILESSTEFASDLTPAGFRVGNLRYMSPERLQGETATEFGDVYALGLVAHEMLTGAHPFGAGEDKRIAPQLRQDPAPIRRILPDLDPDLADVIDRCLARSPVQRPLARDIDAMLARPGP